VISTSREAHYAVISTLLSLPSPLWPDATAITLLTLPHMFCPCPDVIPHPNKAAGRL